MPIKSKVRRSMVQIRPGPVFLSGKLSARQKKALLAGCLSAIFCRLCCCSAKIALNLGFFSFNQSFHLLVIMVIHFCIASDAKLRSTFALGFYNTKKFCDNFLNWLTTKLLIYHKKLGRKFALNSAKQTKTKKLSKRKMLVKKLVYFIVLHHQKKLVGIKRSINLFTLKQKN